MKIPVHNGTGMPIYVGASMIAPGETKHFDKHDVPSHLRIENTEVRAEDADQMPPPDTLADMLKRRVEDVKTGLAELSGADLERLGELEQLSAAPRKGVLGAIAEETLKRAEGNT